MSFSDINITSTGTTIADAYQIAKNSHNVNVTTTGASTGIKLPQNANFTTQYNIKNSGLNSLSVYPPNSVSSINSSSAGIAISINSEESLIIKQTSRTNVATPVSAWLSYKELSSITTKTQIDGAVTLSSNSEETFFVERDATYTITLPETNTVPNAMYRFMIDVSSAGVITWARTGTTDLMHGTLTNGDLGGASFALVTDGITITAGTNCGLGDYVLFYSNTSKNQWLVEGKCRSGGLTNGLEFTT